MSRPPSSEAHQKVLDATAELIADHGVNGASMDAVARLSGVSKATIYKHWTDKEALWLETAQQLIGVLPAFESGDARTDIKNMLRHLTERRKAAAWSRIWPRIIGYAVDNPDFAQALRKHSVEPQRLQLRRILKLAVEKGELHPDTDADLSLSLLVGPIMHRGFLGSQVPVSFIEEVVDAFWRAHDPVFMGQSKGKREGKDEPA
jgi:AcrR family transcriptional regulator